MTTPCLLTIPLRDTYIPATEPVPPFKSNTVIISVENVVCDPEYISGGLLWETGSSPAYTNLWTPNQQNAWTQETVDGGNGWDTEGALFYVNTHGVRTFSNGKLFPDLCTKSLVPYSRSSNFPEAQIGDKLFIHALLNGMGQTNIFDTEPVIQFTNDTICGGNLIQTINTSLTDPATTGLTSIYGFNLSAFRVQAFFSRYVGTPPQPPPDFPCPSFPYPWCTMGYPPTPTPPTPPTPPCPTLPWITIQIFPLISGSYGQNFEGSVNCAQARPYVSFPDWDGSAVGDTSPLYYVGDDGTIFIPLPSITRKLPLKQKTSRRKKFCFYVWLPVQLYNLLPISGGLSALNTFLFTSNDLVTYSAPERDVYAPNTAVLGVKLRGTLLDSQDVPWTPESGEENPSAISFEIVDTASAGNTKASDLFYLKHTYQDTYTGQNRPFYCTESNSIPIFTKIINGVNCSTVICDPFATAPFSTSLLFAPKCGPGIWSNLKNYPIVT